MIKIESPEDPRIEPYLSVRERDLLGRSCRFIAEGEVVVRTLLSEASRFTAGSLFVAESRLPALGPLLTSVADRIPVYIAGRAVMDAIVGFPIHRGLLAVGLVGTKPNAADLLRALPERAVVLALLGISNHDNVGAAFRNAAAFGAGAVLLDRQTCDPLYRKALRVSVGGVLRVPYASVGSADELVDTIRSAGFKPIALSPAGDDTLGSVRWPKRTALLVGAEGAGLPEAVLGRCRSVRIAMAGGFDSLNVATASGIALHAVTTSSSESD